MRTLVINELPPSSKGGLRFSLFLDEVLFASSATQVRHQQGGACIWSQGEILY